MTSREAIASWESGLGDSGLPLVGLDLPAPRPRIVFAAPLPTGLTADRELLDLFLVARWAVAAVRDAVTGVLPPGHELIEVHDVWLGEPPLSGQVAAADYRATLAAGDERPLDLAILDAACAEMLAAEALPRTRDKGGREVAYDLRPLLDSVAPVGVGPDGLATIRIRTRFDPERGVGRPEEVVAAIAELAGRSLEIHDIVRERLVLIGEA